MVVSGERQPCSVYIYIYLHLVRTTTIFAHCRCTFNCFSVVQLFHFAPYPLGKKHSPRSINLLLLSKTFSGTTSSLVHHLFHFYLRWELVTHQSRNSVLPYRILRTGLSCSCVTRSVPDETIKETKCWHFHENGGQLVVWSGKYGPWPRMAALCR